MRTRCCPQKDLAFLFVFILNLSCGLFTRAPLVSYGRYLIVISNSAIFCTSYADNSGRTHCVVRKILRFRSVSLPSVQDGCGRSFSSATDFSCSIHFCLSNCTTSFRTLVECQHVLNASCLLSTAQRTKFVPYDHGVALIDAVPVKSRSKLL
jgi:hypothetical protein